MSPETGIMQQRTIREESEIIVAAILEKQTKLDTQVADLERAAYAGIRNDLGYAENEPVDTSRLVNTRVESFKDGVPANALIEVLPISAKSEETTYASRLASAEILKDEDDRLIVIVGPCSIHDPEEALEYAKFVKKMRKEYGDKLEIIMRAYLEKPRTEKGWKGLINDPNLDNKPNISLGLTMGRLTLCQITNMGVPVAIERIDARTTQHLDGLSTYDAIGARDVQSTRARNYLSVTSAVGGAKNPTDGKILTAVQAVKVAHSQHTYLGDGEHNRLAEVKSKGNETVHVILRGGDDGPNYSAKHVAETKELLRKNKLPEAILIDASHKNSGSDPDKQIEVVNDVARQVALGETAIKGVMIESNLVGGKQLFVAGEDDPTKLEYGKSITDGCTGLEDTEQMLITLSAAVEKRRSL